MSGYRGGSIGSTFSLGVNTEVAAYGQVLSEEWIKRDKFQLRSRHKGGYIGVLAEERIQIWEYKTISWAITVVEFLPKYKLNTRKNQNTWCAKQTVDKQLIHRQDFGQPSLFKTV